MRVDRALRVSCRARGVENASGVIGGERGELGGRPRRAAKIRKRPDTAIRSGSR